MRRSFRVMLLSAALTGIALGAEPVDWVVRARYVLPMDAPGHVIENGAVAIRGHAIVGIGPEAEILERYRAQHTLNKPDALVMPGLIDTHTHAPMSLFRAMADDKKLQEWLERYIFPAESKNVTAEFVRWGTRLACLEMLLAGITTYTDMYYFEGTEAEVARAAGVRAVLGQTIIGFPAPDYQTWQQAISGAEHFLAQYEHDELITPAVAPHAIYTTPDEALVAAHHLAVRYRKPLLIHLSETRKERDDALAQRAATPTQVLARLGVLEGRVVAAHAIWESDEDLSLLQRYKVGVAHCPSSNTKLASGVARVSEMLKRGINVGLGTDGFAGSNDTADLIAEMNLAAKLQKVTTEDPTSLPAEQVMTMATLGGAKVLGLDEQIGSLVAGKRADLITISLKSPHMTPLYNLFSQVAYAAKAGDVEDVFINGREVVRARQVLTLDANEIFAKANQYRDQILKSLPR